MVEKFEKKFLGTWWVNTVGVPGDAGSSPGKSRGGMPKYDPTTKLIILRRSSKTSLWD
jgi:hypothetical protein